MDRQAWEDPTLLKEKTVDDVIAAMATQRTISKGQQTAHNNLSKNLGTVTLSHLTAPVIADFGRLPDTGSGDIHRASRLGNVAALYQPESEGLAP